MEKPSALERFNNWVRKSVTLKLLSIGFLILILLIPSTMMQSLIREREITRDEAVKEVSSKWGGNQQIGGPIISIPYTILSKDQYGKTETRIEYAHFLPDKINISGSLAPEKRYRGIYEVVLYNAKLLIEGNFSLLNFDALNVPMQNYIFKDAVLTLGITDMKGIKENITAKLNDKTAAFNPGINTHDIFTSGISVPVKMDSAGLNFNLNLNLNGSSGIYFLPFGKETNVTINSSWGNPSFEGAFLPDKRDVNANGFSANWKILELNRNYPQQGTGVFVSALRNEDFDGGDFMLNKNISNASGFGVKLLLPVDEYQKTMRSAKYCLMFIIITFLSFFFVEVLKKKRMHPIQYLLVGFAAVLFYVLLLSVSEHLNFNKAYLIGCIIILTLITFYAKAIFKNNFVALLMCCILALLYGFFYSLLQLQDYALLMGSIGLLLILITIMYLTRNIDWYSVSGEKEEKQ